MDIREQRLKFGRTVRAQRIERRLSQTDLGLMISSDKTQIWRIETGRISVGLDIVFKLADALGVEPMSLFDWR